MNKIAVILQKEWLELRQQRGLLLGVILPPLLLTVLPLGTAYGLGHISLGQSLRGQLPTFPPNSGTFAAGTPS